MKSVEKYRIMGIDPGTNYMGYGVLEIEGRTVRSVVLGDIDLHKLPDPYAKLRYIFERVGALVDEYAPREVALESPFFGENVQSMLKLGRAQGVAMVAALSRGLQVFEYAPHASNSVSRAEARPPRSRSRLVSKDAHDRTSAPATGRYGRYGRRPVPPFHEFEPIERRPRRRSVQRTRRRPQGCLGKGQFELGTVFEG